MAPAELRIEVVYSPAAGNVECRALRLPEGSTVSDAIEHSGLLSACPELAQGNLSVGVWGTLRDRAHVLRDRDRVEIYRPLKVDPKEARRQRYRSHRAKRAR